jgi:hypothetical protein
MKNTNQLKPLPVGMSNPPFSFMVRVGSWMLSNEGLFREKQLGPKSASRRQWVKIQLTNKSHGRS